MNIEHPQTTVCAQAEAHGFIRFHGLKMMTVAHEGQEYVAVRPICELIGVDWRGQKRVLEDAYKVQLYGICWLFPPEIDGFSELKFAPNCYIRVNQVEAFLFGINPKRVQANGNAEAAQWLMDLHHEWADVLHRYETHGIAVKAGCSSALEELLRMTKLRNQLNDLKDQRYVDQLIHEGLHIRWDGLPRCSITKNKALCRCWLERKWHESASSPSNAALLDGFAQ